MILPQPAAALGELESSFFEALLPLFEGNIIAIVGYMMNPYHRFRFAFRAITLVGDRGMKSYLHCARSRIRERRSVRGV